MDLIKPKLVTVKSLDGDEKTFYISRFPTVQGREIITQWPVSALPKVGDYKANEAIVLTMMEFVAVAAPDGQRLTTRALVDNHVSDAEMLMQLEKALLLYNTSFFGDGKTLSFFGNLKATLKAFLIETLTDLSAASSKAEKPLSKS